MTVESREGAWGSHGHLLPAALAALMVSFVEPSHSAATTLVRNWLCPSLCPPMPGDSGGRGGCCAGRAGAMTACICPPGICLPIKRQWSPSPSPGFSLSSPRWGWVHHEVVLFAHLPLSVPWAFSPHPGGGSGPKDTPLRDLINQVAWETFVSSLHAPHLLQAASCSLSSTKHLPNQGESLWEEGLEVGRKGERVALTNSSRGL